MNALGVHTEVYAHTRDTHTHTRTHARTHTHRDQYHRHITFLAFMKYNSG